MCRNKSFNSCIRWYLVLISAIVIQSEVSFFPGGSIVP
jgi:hypothetical protein